MFTNVKEHQTTFQNEVTRVRRKKKKTGKKEKKSPHMFGHPAVENLGMP